MLLRGDAGSSPAWVLSAAGLRLSGGVGRSGRRPSERDQLLLGAFLGADDHVPISHLGALRHSVERDRPAEHIRPGEARLGRDGIEVLGELVVEATFRMGRNRMPPDEGAAACTARLVAPRTSAPLTVTGWSAEEPHDSTQGRLQRDERCRHH